MSSMRRNLYLPLALLLIVLPLSAVQRADYVTEEEEDVIRDAQGLQLRAPLFLKLADNRIVALGLRERTAKEREQTKKDLAQYEQEVREARRVPDAEVRAKPLNPDIYLRDYTRTELLRGYMQVLDEVMDNIDDAYDRQLEVRQYVEALDKFVREQLPLFRKAETRTPQEAAALKSLIEHSEQTLEDCKTALRALPRTERKPAKP